MALDVDGVVVLTRRAKREGRLSIDNKTTPIF